MSTTTAAKPVNARKVITGIVRLSYEHIWEARAIDEGGDKKFSAALLIPKSDKATIARINAAVKAAAEEGKAKFGGKVPANLKTPLRDGDEEKPDDENYAGCFFLNASDTKRPGIIDMSGQPITDPELVYSGCFIRASITMYAFNTAGNKGVAAGLNNIQFVKDGEALSGRATAEEDFRTSLDTDADDLM